MAQQTINVGAAINDGTGDPARTAFTKCNANFTELYAATWGNVSNSGTPVSGQLAQWVSSTAIKGVAPSCIIRKFTASSTYTPTVGMVYCIIECVGGGGGGGVAGGTSGQTYGGGGGGSGGYSRVMATAAAIGASKTVTIGSGGAGGGQGGAGGSNGDPGTDTSVGSLCIAKGGSGGTVGNAGGYGYGGAGGVVGTGDITFLGNAGGTGIYSQNALYKGGITGNGAGSYFGGGTPVAPLSGAGISAVNNSGAGGSGAIADSSASAFIGGNGGSGIVIITECIYS